MGRKTACGSRQIEAPQTERLGRLRTMHEGLARDFGEALSALLRCPVDVSLVGVDQVAFGQFVSGLETPSCISVVGAEPLEDPLLLDVEPSILYPMIDRLLGGGRKEQPPPRRPLSDIELPLAARITRLFLRRLHLAWRSVLDMKLEIRRVESNPRLLRILPSDETVVVVGFRLSVGDWQGMMRLCLPCRAMRRIGGSHRQTPPPCNDGATVEVDVTLATTPIAAGELDGLRAGDIVVTETAVGSPAIVSIGGEAKFRAQPGVYQGRKAIRLSEMIENGPPG
jgi:flagellar motor switch protein FliM